MSRLSLTGITQKDNIAIMKTNHYQLKDVAAFIKRRKIATLDELSSAIGNASPRTVFRKLKDLDYIRSYSGYGKYYTLPGIPHFDRRGLWSFKSACFSQFGDLTKTTQVLTDQSDAGYSAGELSDLLHVESKHVLRQLARAERLTRERIDGRYVYFSTHSKKAKSQRKMRQDQKAKPFATIIVENPELAADEAKAAVLLFISSLDEKQRRLYAGLESLKLGYGGDCYIATLFGMDPHTVARGRRELVRGESDAGQIRAPGGGRLSVKKNAPNNRNARRDHEI